MTERDKPGGTPTTDRDAKHKTRADVPESVARGTTHDPNSVTTDTDMEPEDRFPPRGETESDDD
ncbi:hypothetical protein [uncultured Jannaschia sp.]|uniref:hypothetical protein n=1 Tax=uncultured Jannaschia sp. TaxID=293347 RepID=UPI002601983A|nr:hypothetical protein [uncultured Jannaschia sp.]